jgi:hypothetical protein
MRFTEGTVSALVIADKRDVSIGRMPEFVEDCDSPMRTGALIVIYSPALLQTVTPFPVHKVTFEIGPGNQQRFHIRRLGHD